MERRAWKSFSKIWAERILTGLFHLTSWWTRISSVLRLRRCRLNMTSPRISSTKSIWRLTWMIWWRILEPWRLLKLLWTRLVQFNNVTSLTIQCYHSLTTGQVYYSDTHRRAHWTNPPRDRRELRPDGLPTGTDHTLGGLLREWTPWDCLACSVMSLWSRTAQRYPLRRFVMNIFKMGSFTLHLPV